MPYTKSTVPDYVPKSKADKWAKIWNAAYDYAKGDGKSDADAEKYAFATASSKALGEGNDMATNKKEFRIYTSGEVRAVGGTGDADPLAIEGYAAKFGKYSQDLGGFKEIIKAGAFSRALAEGQDVRCLFNHDPNFVLGRVVAKTLAVKEDEIGLFYHCELPNTQVARDLHTSISRGDISQCSFSFSAVLQKWTDEQTEPDGPFVASRELQDVDLFDVSPVTYPAYLDTEVSARAQVEGMDRFIECRITVDKKNQERREVSYEKMCNAVNKALADKFPADLNDNCCWPGGKYYVIDTYTEHLIARDCGADVYCDIKFTATEGADGGYTVEIGQVTPVVQEWVPETPRGLANLAEYRAAKSKVPTKTVSGKVLHASDFAYVGDPKDISTWKYPIYDEAHAKNALARWGQHKGIPKADEAGVYKKIVAAAKSFGIQVTEEDSVKAARDVAVALDGKASVDPDNDGDDDSDLVQALNDADSACDDVSGAIESAVADLNNDDLLAFVTTAQAAFDTINAAITAATAELSEDESAHKPKAEKRNHVDDVSDPDSPDYNESDPDFDPDWDGPSDEEENSVDPAATKPHTEGVSKMSPKAALAQAAAKVAAAHAAIKSAKAAHLAANDELAAAGDDATAKAAAQAKIAAALAAKKQAKADHIAAVDEETQLKAKHIEVASDDIDDLEENPDCEGEFDSTEPSVYAHDHVDGDCENMNCACQNRWNMVPESYASRTADVITEARAASKVRTKRVSGKDLTKDKFAYVGDATKTETWKLPIHDEGHARNALARFSQITGIPADKKAGVYRKIVAACKKFGITVSDEEQNSTRAGFEPDEQDRLLMLARLNESATRN